MSCNDFDGLPDAPSVERTLEVGARPDEVWDELAHMLGDDVTLTPEPGGELRVRDTDGDRVGVVLDAEPGSRLAFRWTSPDGDEPASEVQIALEPSGAGTIVRIRETRLDGDHLSRSAFVALARA